MILLLDNYDSFVFNLWRYFERLGQTTRIVRSDAIDLAGVRELAPAAVVISPGPCSPNEAGASLDIVRDCHRELPILGVCLGHQAIAQSLGGRVVRAPFPMHGRASAILHDGCGVFAGIASPTEVCRYHSLVVDEASLPPELRVTARASDGVVMALEHRDYPVVGVQFHPESILTAAGYPLLANFLRLAGLEPREPAPTLASELEKPSPVYEAPTRPVTF